MKPLSFLLILSVASTPNVSTNTLKNVGLKRNVEEKIIIQIENKNKVLVPTSTKEFKPPDQNIKKITPPL